MKKTQVLEEIAFPQMGPNEVQERLRFFARRAKTLNGTALVLQADGTRKPMPLGAAVSSYLEKSADNLLNGTGEKDLNELFAKMQGGDGEARRQFCALRIESYDNYLMSQLDWINMYFTVNNLADGDQPAEENTTGQELKCFAIGSKGKPQMITLERDVVSAALPLRMISTPLVRVPTWDINRGNIADLVSKSLTLNRDLAKKMERDAFQLLKDRAFGTFVFSGAKQNWPFVTDQDIVAANLPATNDVAVRGAAGIFDWCVLDEIIDYCARWSGLSAQGDLVPTGRVKVASSQLRQFGSGITPGGSHASNIAEALLEKGWTGIVYRGISWVFIPTATLDPADNMVYPEFNFKPGRVHLKPTGDKEFHRTGEQDYKLFLANEEERGMKRVFACSINSASRRNIARFCFTAVTP